MFRATVKWIPDRGCIGHSCNHINTGLQPGVGGGEVRLSRFNGFSGGAAAWQKRLKPLVCFRRLGTRLKPGVNEGKAS